MFARGGKGNAGLSTTGDPCGRARWEA